MAIALTSEVIAPLSSSWVSPKREVLATSLPFASAAGRAFVPRCVSAAGCALRASSSAVAAPQGLYDEPPGIVSKFAASDDRSQLTNAAAPTVEANNLNLVSSLLRSRLAGYSALMYKTLARTWVYRFVNLIEAGRQNGTLPILASWLSVRDQLRMHVEKHLAHLLAASPCSLSACLELPQMKALANPVFPVLVDTLVVAMTGAAFASAALRRLSMKMALHCKPWSLPRDLGMECLPIIAAKVVLGPCPLMLTRCMGPDRLSSQEKFLEEC